MLSFRLTILLGCIFRAAVAGGGSSDFLEKRPGVKQDEKLWNEFLQSESQKDDDGFSEGLSSDGELDKLLYGLSDADLGYASTGKSNKAMRGKGAGALLETTGKAGTDRMQAALQTCVENLFGAQQPRSLLPASVPGSTFAAVAAAAAKQLTGQQLNGLHAGTELRENFVKTRLEACLESALKGSTSTAKKAAAKPVEAPMKTIVASANAPPAPWASWGKRTKNITAVKTAFVEIDKGDPCKKDAKRCKKDRKNCENVLDILQFLRVHNIAVEQTVQREADSQKQTADKSWTRYQKQTADDQKNTTPIVTKASPTYKLLLQTVLEKHGLSLPKPEDWQWTGAKQKLLLQTALENNGVALTNHDWQWKPDEPLVHLIPEVAIAQQQDRSFKNSAAPVKFQHLGTRCPPEKQKQLDDCRSELETCKDSVDDHNSILNSIAERAIHDNQVKLQKYLH